MNSSSADLDCFVYPVLLDGVEMFFLWFTGVEDGVWSEGGRAVCWCSEDLLRRDARTIGVVVSGRVSAILDLDKVAGFVHRGSQIESRDKLDAWNLFADIASSVVVAREFAATNAKLDDVYNRLVSGLHSDALEIVAPGPLTDDDNDVIRRILELGFALLRSCTRIIGVA